MKGRTVLVVDDILDEGVTLAAVRDRLLQQGAARVLMAVVADKENGKEKPIAADFVALTVPDRFVFGFGMDACGAWRNLPAIYAMQEEPTCSA
jgi:hypoxanthine phosphoribosyltransferase